jgi:hypothetical protein
MQHSSGHSLRVNGFRRICSPLEQSPDTTKQQNRKQTPNSLHPTQASAVQAPTAMQYVNKTSIMQATPRQGVGICYGWNGLIGLNDYSS